MQQKRILTLPILMNQKMYNEKKIRMKYPFLLLSSLVSVEFFVLSQEANARLYITPSIDFSVAHADNVSSAPTGQEKSDTILTTNPRVFIENKAMRSDFTIDVGYTFEEYLRMDDFSGNDAQLASTFWFAVVPNFFDIEANASYSQISKGNPRDNVTANNRVSLDTGGSGSTPSQSSSIFLYDISPIFYTHHGEWAESENRFKYSESKENPTQSKSKDAANNIGGLDTKTFSFDQNIGSKSNLSRLKSTLTNHFSRTRQAGTPTRIVKEWTSDLANEVMILRPFALTYRPGWEHHNDTSQNVSNLNGFYNYYGFHIQGRRSDILVERGRKYKADAWNINSQYELTPFVNLTATYTDQTENQSLERLNNLTNSTNVGAGLSFDPLTGQFVNVATNEFQGLGNNIRARDLELGMDILKGRNTYHLTASVQKSTSATSGTSSNGNETIKTYRLNYIRNVTDKADFSAGGSYENDATTGSDTRKTWRFDTGYSYTVSEKVTVSIDYYYVIQRRKPIAEKIRENYVSISLEKQF